jgi:uncharacterized protein (TIGR02145 family)
MKKMTSLILSLFLICTLYAQDLTISFQPKESSTPIDSIQATNLRTTQIVKLLGSESLLLVNTPTNINPLTDKPEVGYIYPNPTADDATFCFSTDKNQEVVIRLFNNSGKLLTQKIQNLTQGTHEFVLKFPIAGIYYISVLKGDRPLNLKVIYTGRKVQNSSIVYQGSENVNSTKTEENLLKSAKIDLSMAYSEGDVMLYSIFSGKNTTIVSDTPVASKAINVEFTSCTDKDNKNYKVVKIGTRWWMAENLAYLPFVSPPSALSFTSPFCYVYDYTGTDLKTAKTLANYTTYGVLYNWPAAIAACPHGWHIPSDAEWQQLEMALGMTQDQAESEGQRGTNQGTQMKTSNGWNSNEFANGNGTNSSGFTALPAGFRDVDRSYTYLGEGTYWWSATEVDNIEVWGRYVFGMYRSDVVRSEYSVKEFGFSVRCIRD